MDSGGDQRFQVLEYGLLGFSMGGWGGRLATHGRPRVPCCFFHWFLTEEWFVAVLPGPFFGPCHLAVRRAPTPYTPPVAAEARTCSAKASPSSQHLGMN